MPDNKLTDNEIIKGYCERKLCPPAQKEINRLQAENESLQIENAKLKGYKTTDWLIKGISPEQLEQEKIQVWKVEAYKDFDELLKDECLSYPLGKDDITMLVDVERYNNLLKELVGE